MITVSGLTRKYGRFVAVEQLSFEVRAGEVLGFLGPNGAGKTTTMRMVTGYLPPTAGRVSIGGHDLYEHPIEARRLIGYLPEHPPVYPEMTVRSYLRFVAALKDVPARQVDAAVSRAIERTRLADVADKRIAKLSKGYTQRVGLAQAIVHEPPVLILDEPTSSLDPKQRADVRDLIAGLRGRHTVLLSTHILPEVREVADRVVIIHRGRVMAVDTPERLGERLRAREVVRAEFRMPVPAAQGDAVEAARAALSALPGAAGVEVTEPAAGLVRARVESVVGTDLRGAVAACVVGRGWTLLGLGGESLSLEDVFLALTGGSSGEAS